jgi:hypothetical protein
MRPKLTKFLERPLGKLIVIEAIIFGIVGILSVILGFTYSSGLMLVGAAIFVLRFTGGSSAPHFSRGALSYELQNQHLRELKDINQMKRRFDFTNDLLIIGAIPLVIGVILSLLRF